MKKGISMVLVFALLMSICLFGSTGVQAADTVKATEVKYPVEGGNIYFNTLTGAVTGCDESITAADIPAEIEGVKVVEIGNSAFYGCSNLESVTIPEGVRRIGVFAFSYCPMLISVTIPDGVTTIANNAFSLCSNLNRIVIPCGRSRQTLCAYIRT